VCNTAITPTVPPIPPRHSKSLGLNVFFPAWVWAQNPDPDGQHPERSIRPDCWMGSGVRFAHLSYDAEFSRFLGEANIERCITKFNAILSCRIFGTPCALNHRPICKVWQGWWKNISPRGEVNRSAVLACAALANSSASSLCIVCRLVSSSEVSSKFRNRSMFAFAT
jgi:hypothetical protein